MSASKTWSGRFDKKTSSMMEAFSSSIAFDNKLLEADILVNKAWAKALARIKIYSDEELQTVLQALDRILIDYSEGNLKFQSGDEDIHSAVERWLTERVGELGSRIHCGKSRNDQVATDVRLFLKKESSFIVLGLQSMQECIVELAEKHVDTVMPGYTHLRQAQPISFAHYLLAFCFQMQRDKRRLYEFRERCDDMPLGSGALAGSAFDIDRKMLAEELGFKTFSHNSIDATSDRDFITECIFICVQVMLHTSRIAEDFIIWSSEPYRFIDIAQEYSTGSSMMPQKRNPDSLELIRGKTARMIGNLNALMNLMKGIPTAYVRDLQEDKEPLFDTLWQTRLSVRIMNGVINTLQVYPKQMKAAIDPALYATDVADYLVKKGIAFRRAHEIVGKIVTWSEEHNTLMQDIPLNTWQGFAEQFDDRVYALFDPQKSLAKRNIPGGTGPASVRQQIIKAKEMLNSDALFEE
ncbi:argininosuccinate lyase [candidate division KSB1 bacterium]|nr:argininosuccinate lyase [candidate division KSB1 bacterium]